MMHDDNMSDDEGRVYVQPEERATHVRSHGALLGLMLSMLAAAGGAAVTARS
jgi:hypothetical protein